MSDDDIMKGLECCKNDEDPTCRDCPYDGVNCKDKLKSDALTLIVQLKAIGNEEARKLRKVVLSQQQTINALLGFA